MESAASSPLIAAIALVVVASIGGVASAVGAEPAALVLEYLPVVLLGLWIRRWFFSLVVAAIPTAITAGSAPELSLLALWGTAIVLAGWAFVEARRESEGEYKQLYFDLAAGILIALDLDYRITLINKNGCKILQREQRDLLGRSWLDTLIAEEDRVRMKIGLDQAAHGARPPPGGQAAIAPLRPETCVINWTHSPVRDPRGRIVGILTAGADVTEAQRAERRRTQRAALESLGETLAVMAHEVKNPLAGISAVLQVLRDRLPPDTHPILGDILVRIKDLRNAVEDVLLFARPRPVELGPVAIRTILEASAARLAEDPATARTSVSIAGDAPIVPGDAAQLSEVFFNLMANAAQAMKGEGRIGVELLPELEHVDVILTDTGPGVPERLRSGLFEPFFTTKRGGTGLGLSSARRIIDAHGGEILAEFPSSGGSKFVVRLPSVLDASSSVRAGVGA